MGQKELARQIGFVGQHNYNDTPSRIVRRLPGRYATAGSESAIITEAMEACNITHLADTLITTSAAASCGAWSSPASPGHLLLLDEPVNHLDVKHQKSIMSLLCRLTSQGYTVICVLHDLLLAQIYSEETIMLKDGAIVAHGPSERVFTAERLKEVYQIDAHQIFDPILGRPIWFPSHSR